MTTPNLLDILRAPDLWSATVPSLFPMRAETYAELLRLGEDFPERACLLRACDEHPGEAITIEWGRNDDMSRIELVVRFSEIKPAP
jgi:hypothetical protein